MDADDVEGIVIAELELQTAGQAGEHTGDGAEDDGTEAQEVGGIDLADQGERAYDFAGTASSVLKEVK